MDKFHVFIEDDETGFVAEYYVYARAMSVAKKKALQMFEDDFLDSKSAEVVTINAERV